MKVSYEIPMSNSYQPKAATVFNPMESQSYVFPLFHLHSKGALRNRKHRKQDEMAFGSTTGKIED
jgi:hypothetical protein